MRLLGAWILAAMTLHLAGCLRSGLDPLPPVNPATCPPGLACESRSPDARAVNRAHFRAEEAARAKNMGAVIWCENAAEEVPKYYWGFHDWYVDRAKRPRRITPRYRTYAGDVDEQQALKMIQDDFERAHALQRECAQRRGWTGRWGADYDERFALYGGRAPYPRPQDRRPVIDYSAQNQRDDALNQCNQACSREMDSCSQSSQGHQACMDRWGACNDQCGRSYRGN